MTATEALERRIDELCRENERLRGQLEYDRQTSRSRAELIDRLKTENAKLRGARDVWQENDAKLRELARFIMHQCNDGNPRCDECIGWNGGECVALQHMRELGVEVNG